MREHRRILTNFSFYDPQTIQNKLEEMATKGWMIRKVGNLFWTFEKIPPQKLRFAVTYFPGASEFDPWPSQKQLDKLTDYEELAASTEAAVDRFHALAVELRETEAALSHTVQLMGATVDFAKTRPVFAGYKAARYSRKYLAQH